MTSPHTPHPPPDRPVITYQGHACAAIVLGEQPSAFYRWLGHELQRYLRQLSARRCRSRPSLTCPPAPAC